MLCVLRGHTDEVLKVFLGDFVIYYWLLSFNVLLH